MNENPPQVDTVYIKDYVYSHLLTLADVTQSKLPSTELYVNSKLGFPQPMTDSDYYSLCLNYQYMDPKYWPSFIKDPNFIHCQESVNKLTTENISNKKQKLKKIQRKIHENELKRLTDSLPYPVLPNVKIPKYSWIAVRGEEPIRKGSNKYVSVIWLAIFLKYTEVRDMVVIQWAAKKGSKNNKKKTTKINHLLII